MPQWIWKKEMYKTRHLKCQHTTESTETKVARSCLSCWNHYKMVAINRNEVVRSLAWCGGQICQCIQIVPGGPWMFSWYNKILKPQLKGNIWTEGLYVSQSKRRRVKDVHRERWWINTREKLSKRIQAQSSCEDLTIPDGVCKTAWAGGAVGRTVCICVCVLRTM